ncbi:MAG TPA: RNA methyltransferase [Bacteroidota bacterium]
MRKLRHDEIAKKRLQRPHEERIPLYSLANNIRSLYNVGSIFRTSDAAGITQLILTGYTPHPPRKEIEKTALGATESVPWEYIRDPLVAIARLREDGIKVFCLEQTNESVPYTSLRRTDFPLCLVIGNELSGVSSEVIQACDGALEIPMLGIKHSLNVAVAYGVAAFEILRCWTGMNGQASNDLV